MIFSKKTVGSFFLLQIMLGTSVMADEVSPPYQWQGAYAGASLGAIWTGSHLTADHVNLVSANGAYGQNLDAIDVDPGFQFGYLHVLDESWVLGAEADFTYPATNSQFTGKTSCCTYDRFNVRNNLQGSLRVRAGHAFDRFLPYVTAGVSWGSMGLYYSNEAGNSYSQSTAQTGWVLGGGIEFGVMEHVSARIEYLYTDYGSALNMDTPTISGITIPGASAHADMSTNVLRAAGNYRF
jgi:outer membrane immunogenic protein